MKWVKNTVRFVVVTVAVVAITSFTIDATDALNGSQSALSIIAKNALEEGCPYGTKRIDLSDKSLCVDIYENSPGEECPKQKITSNQDTQQNLNEQSCRPESTPETEPWVNVSYLQARTLCASKGARLPTASEWYESAMGTREESCNLDGNLSLTGEFPECVSSRGMHDTVGNVWEWVDEEINNGEYRGRSLPGEGYVAETDVDGVAVETSVTASQQYDSDYFWHNSNGVYAMMRGGFHGSEEDGGVYTVHTEVRPSFSSAAIGFRCVQNI